MLKGEPQDGTAAGSSRLGLCLTLLLGIPAPLFFGFAAFSPASLAVPLAPGKPVTVWARSMTGFSPFLNGTRS